MSRSAAQGPVGGCGAAERPGLSRRCCGLHHPWSTTQVQGQINVYQDPYAHSAMATRTLLAMDNAADPWNAAANPAAVDEKATQMKAYYREEMAEKLAKRKAFDERKAAEKSAEKSAPSEPARDLRYEDTGGDFNVFGRLGGLLTAGFKKSDEEE